MSPMQRLAIAAVALSSSGWISPALADSMQAYCVKTGSHQKVAIKEGPCLFSQRQGNVTIQFNDRTFDFPLAEEGQTYTRMNREGQEAGPVFTRAGKYTLSVYWQKPQREAGGY